MKKVEAEPETQERERRLPAYSVNVTSALFFAYDFENNKVTFGIDISTEDVVRKVEERASDELPMDMFKDEAQFLEFVATTHRVFHETVAESLKVRASEHFSIVGNLAVDHLKIQPLDFREFVGKLTQHHAGNLKRALHIPPRGRHSQWKKAELVRELRAIVRTLPKDEQTLKGIHARLKANHPNKAPKSPQSLKQLIYRFKLDLKTIKNGGRKGKVNNAK